MSRFSRLLLLAALVPVSGLAQEPPAAAPAPAADSTAHRHVGVFIRLELGYAWFGTSSSSGGIKVDLSGSGASYALAIGGAVAENFVIAAAGWHFFAASPEIKLNGSFLASASGGNAGLVGYGVLFNWYMHPSNFYVAVNPAMTQLVATDGSGNEVTSDWGFGVRAGAGKEWWVSDHWGVGLAASVAFSSNKGPVAWGSPTWGSTAFNLTCSATYN